MFKVNNKNTKTTPRISPICSSVSIVNFEHVNAGREKEDDWFYHSNLGKNEHYFMARKTSIANVGISSVVNEKILWIIFCESLYCKTGHRTLKFEFVSRQTQSKKGESNNWLTDKVLGKVKQCCCNDNYSRPM